MIKSAVYLGNRKVQLKNRLSNCLPKANLEVSIVEPMSSQTVFSKPVL